MPKVTAYRKADGTYTYRVRIWVGKRQSSETFPSRAAAQAFAKRVERVGGVQAVAELNRVDTSSDDYVPTLREWFATYMANASGITPRTRTDYDRLANRAMLPMLGDLRLDDITRPVVQQWTNALEREPRLGSRGKKAGKPTGGTLSPKTIAGHRGLLSALMKAALIEGYIDRNPCLGVRLPRGGEHERVDAHFMTHAEWDAIEAQLPEGMARALGTFLVGSGMRWSEATALQVRHINLAQGTAHVVQAWKKDAKAGRYLGPPKTSKSRRTVVLARQAVEAVRPLVEGQPADAFVFRTGSGKPPFPGSFMSRIWTPACERAGVNPRPRLHDTRHTHASWLLEYGATLEQVQDQLGHESILTTRKVYGSLQPAMRESLRDAATAALSGHDAAQIEGAPTP